jgi:hypothetical protein
VHLGNKTENQKTLQAWMRIGFRLFLRWRIKLLVAVHVISLHSLVKFVLEQPQQLERDKSFMIIV